MSDYELFIVIKNASRLRGGLGSTLEPLVACFGEIPILSASARRDDDEDVALIGVVLAIEVLPARMRQQLLLAAGAALQVLETARLPPEQRTRFYDVHLAAYRTILDRVPTVEEALRAYDDDRRKARAAPSPPAHTAARTAAPRRRARSAAKPGSGPLELFFDHDGDWYRTRIVTVGAEHVTAITSVPPLCGLEIDLAFSRGGGAHELRVRAKVTKSSLTAVTTEGQLPAFSARLLPTSEAHAAQIRDYLAEALKAEPARARPPLRRDVRLPFRSPATLARGGRRLAVTVVDVSRRGVFVATGTEELSEAAIGKEVEVEMRLPGGDGPLRFAARVARVIPRAVADARGLAAGVGLELMGSDAAGLARFEQFVDQLAADVRRKLSRPS